VTPAMAGEVPAPTDAQLNAFIQENADRLRAPEFRMVSVVLFTPEQNAAPSISDERIRERFEFKKDSLGKPETRTFVTLTAPNRDVAQKIAAALRTGQSPTDVGRANSIQPANFDATPRAAIGDAATAAAVFGLQTNQVSEPVQAGVGFAVAKVTAIQPGQAATLENSREQIVQELREEDVKTATYAKVEKYQAARTAGKNLADAAREAGGRIVDLPPFTQDGKLPNGQGLNAPPQIFQTAWSLTKGGESDVIDAGQGQYFAVRVNDIRPAALPNLAEVRGPLAAQWTQREVARRLSAKAEELAGKIRQGQDIAAVARSVNAPLVVRTAVVRDQATQQSLGQGVLQGLFGQAKGQVFSQPGETGYLVGRVDNIHAANPAVAGPLAEQARPRITQELIQAMVQAEMTAGAQRSKAKNDPSLVRQALGLSAAPTAPAAPAQ